MRALVAAVRSILVTRRGISSLLAVVAVLGAAAISASAKSQHHRAPALSKALKRQLAGTANQHVIVILKSQLRAAHVGSRSAAARAAAIRAAQAPVVRQLEAVRATHIKRYQLINAVAATVSKAERTQLGTNAAVARVIPDTLIRGASPTRPAAAGGRRRPRGRGHPHHDPRCLRSQRQGAARSGRPVLDEHELR